MARGVPGARCADSVGCPCHRVELQAETSHPCREAPAHALDGRQRTIAKRQALVPRLFDPLCTTFGAGGLDGAEDGAAHRFYATKAERSAAESVQPRSAIDPPIDPGWRVHRRHKMSGLADKKLVPALAVFAVGERETRHEDTIEKPFKAGRHRAPPCGENEGEMLRPGDKANCIGDAGFHRLVAGRRHQDIWLENEVREREALHLGPSVLCSCRICICQCLAEAAPAGMTKNDENLGWPGSQLGTGSFAGSSLLEPQPTFRATRARLALENLSHLPASLKESQLDHHHFIKNYE